MNMNVLFTKCNACILNEVDKCTHSYLCGDTLHANAQLEATRETKDD